MYKELCKVSVSEEEEDPHAKYHLGILGLGGIEHENSSVCHESCKGFCQ